MADTFSGNIKLRLQQIGGNNNSWGTYLNTDLDTIDAKFGDVTAISTTGGNTTLSDSQETVAAITVSGALVSNANVIFSGRGGFWIFKNNTSGSPYTVTAKVSGQTGVVVDQGNTVLIWCTGTDIALGNPPTAAVAEATIASASTTDVLGAASEFVAISGTGTITSLGTGTNRKRFVRATGAFTLTHNATSLICPGGADIVAASGDTFIVVGDSSSNARILAYQKANGAPLKLAGTIAGDATLSGAITFSGADNAFSSTECVSIPGGTTAQRPASPATKDFRYNSTLGIVEFYDGTSWRSLTAPLVEPQGYLTLATSSTDPIITSDQSAKTAVYYTPFVGNLVPISTDGVVFIPREFAQLTLSLVSNHLANAIYDVFVWDESGTITIGTGPAWNTATAGSGARGTGAGTTELTRLKGLRVNANSMTTRNGSSTYTVAANKGTYLGSISIDGSAGQVTCHTSYGQSRKWGVWNAYNRRKIYMKSGDSTSSWSVASAYPTFAATHADATNKISTFCGLPEEVIALKYSQDGDTAATSRSGYIAIGVNSTSTVTGTIGHIQTVAGNLGEGCCAITASSRSSMMAFANVVPGIGINNIQMLEAFDTGCTFNGTEARCCMTAEYMG